MNFTGLLAQLPASKSISLGWLGGGVGIFTPYMPPVMFV